MIRLLSRLGAVVAGALLLTTVHMGPAAAFGQETLGCRFAPGTVFTFSLNCTARQPATSYSVAFAVAGGTGTYTYTWSITGDFTGVVGGCTATSSTCTVSTLGGNADRVVHGTVTLHQGTLSRTLTSTARINAFCGTMLC